MDMKKRILSLCLALALLLCLLPAAPTAAAAGDVAINATNFPDFYFRRFVGKYDTDHDGSLSAAERAAVTRIDCSNNNILNLKGIEYFTYLKTLYCGRNQLSSLDLSKNPDLKMLGCWDNQLTSLDLRYNSALEELYCQNNRLTSLDSSNNFALTRLHCYKNQLTSLDLSKNTALTSLGCYSNQLTFLDLSAVPALRHTLENGHKDASASEYDWYISSMGELYVDKKVVTIPKGNTVSPFTDVKESDYYYDAVLWAVEKKVTAGTSATTFSPSEDCTRAQVVTFLWRAAGSPEPKTATNPFQDVREKDYFYKAVLWAVENGITSGTSKTRFSPNESCTRAQVVTFLWRYEKQKAPKSAANPFKDVKADAYYYKAVLWAVEQGITQGTSKTKFSPDDTCTRGQIVTFLYRDLAGK